MKVEYIQHMGSDLTVVNAARVSMDKHSAEFSDSDAGLLRYLAKHEHFTPFTHCQITVREKVPIFVARQRFKHTVGFSYNEVSRRYVKDIPELFYPPSWRKSAANVKQGSGDDFDAKQSVPFDIWLEEHHDTCLRLYDKYLGEGVAPEQARMVLPQSMYTSYYVTGSLMAFARAYKLRADAHSQKEIQDVAKMWDEVIRPMYPAAWESLVGH